MVRATTTLTQMEKDVRGSIRGTAWTSLRRLISVALALMAICLVAVLIARFSVPPSKSALAEKAASPVMTVSCVHPAVRLIERELLVNGPISVWDPVSVGATIGGLEIKSILVEEGNLVKKGQVLATLDDSQLVPKLDSERARLAASLAGVKKSVQPNRPEDITGLSAAASQAEATVEGERAALVQAEENLLNAKQNIKRYQYLQAQGAVSTQELETRELTAKVAEAVVRSANQRVKAAEFALKQAQERLSMAQVGGRLEDIQIAYASVAEIQANVRRLEAELSKTVIHAPVNGLITKRDGHIGDISTIGKTLFAMARDNRLELRAEVPEGDLSLVKPGQKVIIQPLPSGKELISGRVREISPLVDSDTRLATARIDIPANCGLKAGMYAEGRIHAGSHEALTVPARAVIVRDERPLVFVLQGNHVAARNIIAGARSGQLIEIQSGTMPQDQIVVDGAGFLKDGDCVAVGH